MKTFKEQAKAIKPPPPDATAEKDFGKGNWTWNNGYAAGHFQAVADARAVCRQADKKVKELEKQAEELKIELAGQEKINKKQTKTIQAFKKQVEDYRESLFDAILMLETEDREKIAELLKQATNGQEDKDNG